MITINTLKTLHEGGLLNLKRICAGAGLTYETIITKLQRGTVLTSSEAQVLDAVLRGVRDDITRAVGRPGNSEGIVWVVRRQGEPSEREDGSVYRTASEAAAHARELNEAAGDRTHMAVAIASRPIGGAS